VKWFIYFYTNSDDIWPAACSQGETDYILKVIKEYYSHSNFCKINLSDTLSKRKFRFNSFIEVEKVLNKYLLLK
jgi:hypothetical protein